MLFIRRPHFATAFLVLTSISFVPVAWAQSLPASIVATAGTPQSAAINTVFATPLQATVLDANKYPVPGVTVTFTAPASGASGAFSSVSSATVQTNASGVAVAPEFRANGIPGTYTVVAAVKGLTATVAFSVTNLAPAAATLNVAPEAVSFWAYPGFPTPAKAVSISLTGAAVPFSASANSSGWLSVDTKTGTAPATVRVKVDATGLVAGTYTGSVQITTSGGVAGALETHTIAVTMTVPLPSDVIVAPVGDLSFTVPPGSASFTQTLSVISGNRARLPVTASVSGAPQFASVSPGSGDTPASLTLTIDPGSLAPGTYKATVTVRSVQNSVTKNVTLLVQPPNPAFSVYPPVLPIEVRQGAIARGDLEIQNSGGANNQSFTAAVVNAAEKPWVSVAPQSGSLSGTDYMHVQVTADVTKLTPGIYAARIQITVATPFGKISHEAPVTITVQAAADAVMRLDEKGTSFRLRQGEGLSQTEQISVLNLGSKPFPWTAEIVTGGQWLALSTSQPQISTPTSPGKIILQVRPDFANSKATSTGGYYASVRVSAPQAANSPQLITAAAYVLDPATNPPIPRPDPAGITFRAPQGGTAPPQAVRVFTSTQSPQECQVAAQTYTGPDRDAGTPVDWLAVDPTTIPAGTNTTSSVQVSVNAAGLAPGVYTGGVTFSMSTTDLRTVSVTLVVTPPAPTAVKTSAQGEATGCVATKLVPTFTDGLVNNFATQVAGPTPVSVQVTDDCGVLVPDPNNRASDKADVTITFSAGDPNAKRMLLTDPQNASYSMTWTPDVSVDNTQVTVVAKLGDLAGMFGTGTTGKSNREATSTQPLSGTRRVSGQVLDTPGPVLIEHGTLNNLNPTVGGLLAPGTLVQIFGRNLYSSDQPFTASSLPLPTAVNGTQVMIAGVPAPLYYASKTQVDAQIPAELPPGRSYEVQVYRNDTLTAPDEIEVVNATPGLAATADGHVIAQHADFSLVTSTHPALPGELVIIYLVGMGQTNPPVASGAASPTTEPLARVTNAPALMLDSTPVTSIGYAGQTPGFVGLYQINFTVPQGITPGDHSLTVTQNGEHSNAALLSVGTR